MTKASRISSVADANRPEAAQLVTSHRAFDDRDRQ